MDSKTKVLIGFGAVAALAIVGYIAARRLGPMALANANLVNPLSRDNLVYRGASSVIEALTGVPGDTVGTALHRWTSTDLDPTRYTQAELERITAAGNHWGRNTGGWYLG